jgi:hypothetical protein
MRPPSPLLNPRVGGHTVPSPTFYTELRRHHVIEVGSKQERRLGVNTIVCRGTHQGTSKSTHPQIQLTHIKDEQRAEKMKILNISPLV